MTSVVAPSATAQPLTQPLDTQHPVIGNDPLAYLLVKLKLLGQSKWQKWWCPLIFTFFYFGVNNIILPLIMGRFASKPDYLGPFDPKMLPFRLADALPVPALVYYYGQATLLFSTHGERLKDGTMFDQLVKNGIFGPPDSEAARSAKESEKIVFERWVGWMGFTPLAIALALWIAVGSSFQYASPPRPHLFINSEPTVLLFNAGMWLVNYYMIAIIIMRLVLISAWLLRFYWRSPWRQLLNVDVLNPDDRMGFSPITAFAVFSAKMLLLALIFTILVLRGNQNIGLSPGEWTVYLIIVGFFILVVFFPLYLVHKIMIHQKDRLIDEITRRVGNHMTATVREWPKPREAQWKNLLMEQMVLIRLSQVRDSPVTLSEANTVTVSYFIGTLLTLASGLQSLADIIGK